jgi:hypothetical protein
MATETSISHARTMRVVVEPDRDPGSGQFGTTNAVAPRQLGPHVWWGADLASDPGAWTFELSPEHVAELIAAAQPFATGPGDGHLPLIGAADFPLPTLAPELAAMAGRLIGGRGFELVRGLPVGRLTRREVAAAFLGIGAHLGSARSQNAAGHILGHVRNLGLDVSDPAVRIYQTSARQTFHTDSTDVVGLLCLDTAAEGGDSLLVSAGAVYNEMLDRDPDLAAALFEPIATDRRGEVPEGHRPWFEIPVLNWFDGNLTVLYQRQYIESVARFDDAPRPTPRQLAALDLFDAICNDARFFLAMELRPGDMQFVYNHALLHDRTAFVDRPEAPRHLLRLWLSMPADRALPPAFAQRYGSLTVGDRGGIVTADTVPHAALVPVGSEAGNDARHG